MPCGKGKSVTDRLTTRDRAPDGELIPSSAPSISPAGWSGWPIRDRQRGASVLGRLFVMEPGSAGAPSAAARGQGFPRRRLCRLRLGPGPRRSAGGRGWSCSITHLEPVPGRSESSSSSRSSVWKMPPRSEPEQMIEALRLRLREDLDRFLPGRTTPRSGKPMSSPTRPTRSNCASRVNLRHPLPGGPLI